MIAHLKAAGLVALVGLTAACATKGAPPPVLDGRPLATSADAHRIKVSEVGERLEVSIADGALSPTALFAIENFATEYRRMGHGPMALSAPKDANPQMTGAVIGVLADAGIPAERVSVARYDAGDAAAPLVLRFTRYDAEAPKCPSLSLEDTANAFSNRPVRSFGCAMQANLAAMIADPADLAAPRAMDPADAARRALVVDKYRQGEQTHATRSEDERVTVSRVAR